MVTRNVDLVIRARNEASKAIDQINSALEEFVGAQKEISAGAQKTDTVLSRLGKSIQGLNAAFSGSAAGQIANQLDKARQAITQMEAATSEATGSAIGYTRELRQAAAESAKLKAQAAEVTIAIKAQQVALRAAKSEQSGFTAEIKRAETARAKLVAEDQKLTAQIQRQAAALEKTKAAYADLGQRISAAENPSKRLTQAFESKSKAVAAAEARLEELRVTQGAVQNAIGQTANAIERSNQKLSASTTNYARLEKVISSLAKEQASLGLALKGSQAAQETLAKSADRSASALERQDAALNEAQGELRQLEGTASETAGAMERLAAAVRGDLLKAFGVQRAAVQKTQTEWKAAEARVKELALAMRSAGQPSAEMAASFQRAREAARLSKTEFLAQRDALQQMRGILRESGGDVSQLADRVDRLSTIYRVSNASLEKRNSNLARLAASEAAAASSAGRAASATQRVTSASTAAAGAQQRAATATISFSEALRRFYGNSRTALSFTQRLRSEVLSLVAAYGGLFAVIQGGRSAVNAIQTIEAAQSRLNVVFDGNQGAVGNELEFIRETARRLGIEFGTLAQEYTKFAVATKGTNLEGEATRTIFIRVAEAARVNKLRLEDVKGVFTALSQIAGKGAVQMEELRQQLGDRLPGAVQIMADAIGVGVDELFNMTQAGELSSDALLDFANELDKRFGAQLPAALQTTTTAIGRFQNAVFEAFETIARSGFIESFTAAVLDLQDTLQSPEGIAALKSMGQAAATLVDVFAALAVNFDNILIALGALVGARIAPFFVALVGQFRALNVEAKGFFAQATRVARTFGGIGTAAGAAATAVFTFRRAMQVLLSTTGIGLAVTVIGALIGDWITQTDDATSAMERHRNIVDQVKQAYFEAQGGVGKFVEQVAKLRGVEVQKNLEDMAEAAENARDEFASLVAFGARDQGFETNLTKPFRGLRAALEAFEAGAFESGDAFLDVVDQILLGAEHMDTDAKQKVLDLAEAMVEAKDAYTEAGLAARAANGDIEAARELVGEAAKTTDAHAEALKKATVNATKYSEAMAKLQEGLPGVGDQLERIQEVADLDAALQSAIKYATTMGQVERALAVFQERLQAIQQDEALAIFDGSSSDLEKSVALLKNFEGFQSTGKFDVNAFRAGFGSDTVTLADGTIKAITEGMRVSMEDALRDLVRRIGEFQNVIKKQIGEDTFGKFSGEQQAALTSIAYNYGRLPTTVVEAVKEGTTAQIADAIRALSTDNEGINANRRQREAAIFEGTPDQALVIEEERLELLEEQTKEREKAEAATAKAIEDGAFEIEQQRLKNEHKEREATIEAAVREAKLANKDITDEQIAKIREQTAALYDLENAEKAIEEAKKRAAAADAEVNNLLTIRQQLTEQLKLLEETGGENSAINATRLGIEEINNQLQQAIERAILMWQALSGTEAEAAIAKLNTVSLTLERTGKTALIDYKQVQNLVANGLTNAFDQFAKAVAEGESATKALATVFRQFAADFLRQIAQMIIKQIIFNALKAISKSLGFGVGHHGGLVSSIGRRSRRIDPGVFMGAMRYHGGGIAGLKPDEVPIIAQKNEEIITDSDPRHRNNLGQSSSGSTEIKQRIINAFDSGSFLEEALATPAGEELLLNHVRANSSALRAALGV